MIFVLTSGSYPDYGSCYIIGSPDSGIAMCAAALAAKMSLSEWLERQPGLVKIVQGKVEKQAVFDAGRMM